MNTYLTLAAILSTLTLGTHALAQPLDPEAPTTLSPMRPAEAKGDSEPANPSDSPDGGSEEDLPADPYANLIQKAEEYGGSQEQETYPEQVSNVTKPAKPASFPKMHAPHLLAVPTGHLLPAGVVHSTTSLDTGGSFGGSLRIGLGDVGEFGVETSPRIRMQRSADAAPHTVQPLILASFRMGVGEDRLFKHQPAMALGFRKSFSREEFNNDIRVAGIDLVASKTLGKTKLHVGGVFWDASMSDVNSGEEVLLHDTGTKRQIRPFGGIEAEPIKNAQLLIDLYWVPLFSPFADSDKDAIKLTPTLSWGVRYHLSKKVSFESGVRVPDIGEVNLLDAQIFGQLSIASDKIRRALGVSK